MAKEGLGLEITELRLGLPGCGVHVERNEKKRVFSEITADDDDRKSCSIAVDVDAGDLETQNKSQAVGWPPVCSYRKKNSFNEKISGAEFAKMYVKVSMDGTPFLRKIDLSSHKGYSDLLVAFEKLFHCFGIGDVLKDAESSEYAPIYEDKDGDWMLVGDVPWEMFIESCKRLRIMKRAEAKGYGLQPRRYLKGKPRDG